MTEPVSAGGFAGFRDANGEVWIGRSSFEKLMPHHFGRLTESQKSGCECVTCLNGEYMMADYVSWQKTSRRKQQTYINGLSEKLKSGNLSQPEQVAIAEEYETAREDLKQFLEGSFKWEDINWLPKCTKLQDMVNNEMTCQLIKKEEKL